jgi:hypothetical protein
MKRFNIYILKNTDFLHGLFVAMQWIFLLIVFSVKDDNNLKGDWLDSAFILSGIGYLSFILFPIFILQSKLIFREKSKNIVHGIIIILFYSEIFFIFQFIFTVVSLRDDPLFWFANTGIIFTFSCFEKILNMTRI